MGSVYIIGFAINTLIFLSFLLKSIKKPIFFHFTLFLFSVGYIHQHFYFIYSQKLYLYPHLMFTYFPIALLIGPSIYLFIKNLSQDNFIENKRDLIHYLPSVIGLFICIPLFTSPVSSKYELIYQLYHDIGYVRTLPFSLIVSASILFYVVYIFSKASSLFHFKTEFQKKIIVSIIVLIMLYTCFMIPSLFSVNLTLILSKIAVFLGTYSLLLITFFQFHHPNSILAFAHDLRQQFYTKSQLTNINLEDLDTTLTKAMEKELLYCNAALNLKELAQHVDITAHQLSEFLNKYKNQNFSTFITHYRVEKAKELLVKFEWRTTLSIALEVGFNSNSSFIRGFKKVEGISPGIYRKQHFKKEDETEAVTP